MNRLRINAAVTLAVGLVLACIAGLVFKTHCLVDGIWYDSIQYTSGCYSDAVPFWGLRGVAAGQLPYFETRIEYPALTGALIWLEGTVTRIFFGPDAISTNFLSVVVLVNGFFAFGILDLLKRLDVTHGRLWAWAASPLLVIYIGQNWDLLAVLFTVGALLMARQDRLILASALAGLGASAKLYPALLVPVLCLQALVASAGYPIQHRLIRAFAVGSAAFGAWLAVNMPVALFAFENWIEFYKFSSERGTTAASIWEILAANGLLAITHGVRNQLALALVIFGTLTILALGWRRHSEHLWTLSVPVIAWFIFVNKVYSPQFDLWLFPLLLLTVRRAAPIALFALGSFLAFYTELWWFAWQEGASFGVDRWALELAAIARAIGLFWAMGSAIFEPAPAWIPGGKPYEDRWPGAAMQRFLAAMASFQLPAAKPLQERDEWGRLLAVPPQTGFRRSMTRPIRSKPAPIEPLAPEQDPISLSTIVTATFLAIASYGLLTPSSLYFDETHYIPAARNMLQLVAANQEHPLLAKAIMATSISLLGDQSLAWRLPSLIAGALGLFAFGRLVWWTSRRRFATIAALILLGTNFLWFIHSRIAMLDIFAAALYLVALWQFAAAVGGASRWRRWRLIATGIFLGLSLGAKWSVAPLLPLPGLAFAIVSWREHQALMAGNDLRSLVMGKSRKWPLLEGVLTLAVLPICVYWATFTPAFFYMPPDTAVSPFNLIGQQLKMIASQASAGGFHTYQSIWSDWVFNLRPVWYLYENVDGAQRGVLLLGNPFSMLAGLPAAAWCCWVGLRRRQTDAAVFAALYLIAIAFWVVAAKPVQFYYHYLLPATFLMACLALALDGLSREGRGERWLAWAGVALPCLFFVWFYPIISAIPLHEGPVAFERWMWLDSWR